MNLEADAACLLSEIEALALLSEAEPPVVTRIVFTPADMRARAWLIERCKTAGLSVRQDAVGNTFARWQGFDTAAPAVGTRSHIDAIPNPGSTMESWEFLADLRQYALCNALDSIRRVPSSCCCLRRRSRRALESDVSAVGCSPALSRRMRPES